MGDKIYTTPIVGLPATAYGLDTAKDDYGNEISGRDLKCVAGPKIRLSLEEWSKVYRSIEVPHAQADMVPDGIIDLGEMASPLAERCKQAVRETKPSK